MFNKGKFIKIGLYGPKTGSKLGGNGPKTFNKSLNSCHIHQNWVFAVVIFGLYDPKTGSKLGLSGPKWCQA
jgi:hypothetical protein